MKRVLLKLSGEALAGDKHTGFDDRQDFIYSFFVAVYCHHLMPEFVQLQSNMPTESAETYQQYVFHNSNSFIRL